MNIPADIIERITRAADELFAASGRETFPTVDQVRRAARTDMNAASAVMRDWRRAQTAQVERVAVQVPDSISQASAAALADLWAQAQDLGNEKLRTAQAGWEGERAEMESLRAQLADAYDAQSLAFEQVQNDAAAAAHEHHEARQQAALELAAVRTELAQALTRAEREEAAAKEIQHRAEDLRAELTRAHLDADQLRAELATQQQATQTANTERDQARVEGIRLQTQIEASQTTLQEQRQASAIEIDRLREERRQIDQRREDVQQQLAEARERAAGLAGQLEAVQAQSAALLARLPAAEQKPGKR